jgi:hypothetical protein
MKTFWEGFLDLEELPSEEFGVTDIEGFGDLEDG